MSTEQRYDSAPETLQHIKEVRDYLYNAADELSQRGKLHDYSKLISPEREYFDKYTPLLGTVEFGTPEYLEQVQNLRPALDHHYANNSHHPQHYENGITGMNLFDIVEMFFDWKASSERTKNGDIRRSIDINAERFGISKQLKNILVNTLDYVNKEGSQWK